MSRYLTKKSGFWYQPWVRGLVKLGLHAEKAILGSLRRVEVLGRFTEVSVVSVFKTIGFIFMLPVRITEWCLRSCVRSVVWVAGGLRDLILAIHSLHRRFWLGLGAVVLSVLAIFGLWQKKASTKTKQAVAKSKQVVNKSKQKAQKKAKEQVDLITSIRLLPQASFFKPVLSFAILLLCIMAPLGVYQNYRFFSYLKDKLTGTANAAIGNVFAAKTAMTDKNFQTANDKFSRAGSSFLQAQSDLSSINSLLFDLAKVVPNQKVKLAGNSQSIVEAGSLAAKLGASLSLAADGLFANKGELTDKLSVFIDNGKNALTTSEELARVLSQIDSQALPKEYQEQFVTLRDKTGFINGSLRELLDISEKLQIFLGSQHDKRYLLVFQNNTEARATGGFMGSFAIVDFSKGLIKQMKTPGGGTYDTEAGLRHLVVAPEPLWLVNPLWHLWDCNWWPDWPTSAKKISWFYENSDGSSTDGVISLTQDVVIQLLALVGPIEMPEYHTTITADNFLDTVQYFAEQKDKKTNTPKQIIGDLSDKLMEKLKTEMDKEKMVKLLGLIETNLNNRNILLYFDDAELESKIAEQGWDGATKETSGDYLMVVNTNIGGGKSDRRVNQTIDHSVTVSEDGSLVDTVIVRRTHTGQKGDLFSGMRNVDWMRVYVPLGSELIAATGFRQPEDKYLKDKPKATWEEDELLRNEREAAVDLASGTKVYREGEKTVFANWSMIDRGETAEIKLVYRLPFKLNALPQEKDWVGKIQASVKGEPENLYKYTLLTQKQSGQAASIFSSRMVLPEGYKNVWHYPEGEYSSLSLDSDKYSAYLISN